MQHVVRTTIRLACRHVKNPFQNPFLITSFECVPVHDTITRLVTAKALPYDKLTA